MTALDLMRFTSEVGKELGELDAFLNNITDWSDREVYKALATQFDSLAQGCRDVETYFVLADANAVKVVSK